ncbi:hypothetical protein M422DRAFT_26030 [Sphaerobolus stellatus SS14]|nr:hypothetical protein M422DRAFT_26030 [Sphaerobolus stellatus SS14]
MELALPAELWRDVVELAAFEDPSTGFNLLLVSKTVHEWIKPVLYRFIALEDSSQILSFIHGVEEAQCNATDPTRFTRRLSIHRRAINWCDWTLSLFSNADIQELLICPEFRDPGPIPDDNVEGVELWPKPRHVMLLYVHVSWFRPRIALFEHTTHLYLDNASHQPILDLCATLPLIHVGFGFWLDYDDEERLLVAVEAFLSIPTIQLVSVHALVSGAPIEDYFGGVWGRLADIEDERLVVMPGYARGELIDLFDSYGTVWDRIEEFRNWREEVRLNDGEMDPLW